MIKTDNVYEPNNFHFITEYPENRYIEKTITYDCETDGNRQPIKMGKIEVYLRNGEQYSFECWVTYYASQFGTQVSHDGQYVYANSDEKGLWCYTYKGDLVWKTRYTSVSYVIPHPNNNVTCVTTTKLLVLDSNGKVIKQVPIYREGMSKMASDSVIVSNTSERIITLFDSITLDVLCKISLKTLGLKYICKAELNNNTLVILGYSLQRETITVEVDLSNDSSIIQNNL